MKRDGRHPTGAPSAVWRIVSYPAHRKMPKKLLEVAFGC
jgi:hypothetical protein